MSLSQYQKISIVIVLLVIAIVTAIWVLENPFKVIDPTDQRFEIQQFQFEDYGENREELYQALIKIFPQGTPHNVIYDVLVNHAGVERMGGDEVSGTYIFFYKPRHSKHSKCNGWRVLVSYDRESQLENLKLFGPCT
ncbi:MAG: hypothetical protein CL565_00735 [Alphaproteobacteria bacterium]|nr:hypothetical protein [Alphaproteobacteria bacterium]